MDGRVIVYNDIMTNEANRSMNDDGLKNDVRSRRGSNDYCARYQLTAWYTDHGLRLWRAFHGKLQ